MLRACLRIAAKKQQLINLRQKETQKLCSIASAADRVLLAKMGRESGCFLMLVSKDSEQRSNSPYKGRKAPANYLCSIQNQGRLIRGLTLQRSS